jgi:pimeloyl-ACP methyl ester carboxylesterase
VNSLDDLYRLVRERIDRPVDLVAQSMGGVLAMRAALEFPQRVRRLVLTATSGGLDVRRLGAADWRGDNRRQQPHTPEWFRADRTDLTARLPEVKAPVLLIWGDADPVSPVAVGRYLVSVLPDARLIVVPGGDHMLARDRAADVVPAIRRHLMEP